MVLLYMRGRGKAGQPTEISLERVEGTTVEDLRTTVASQMNVDREELSLMYGGCILQRGKTLDQYRIKDGCTLHVMQSRKKVKYAPLPIGPEGMTVIFANSTIQSEIAQFINDPDLVSKMVPLGNPSEVREILQDPDFLTKVSDMSKINHHIHKSYLLFPVMQALLRLHRLKYSVRDSGRMEQLSAQVGQILELASSGNMEVGGAVGGAIDDANVQYGQQQVLVPVEASTQHPPLNSQLMHGTIHHLPPSSSLLSSVAPPTNTAGAAGTGPPSLSVTPADLASALASIEQSDSQPSSLYASSLELSPQPQSLPVINPDHTGSSAPASLRPSELLPVPGSVNRSLSDSGRGGAGTGPGISQVYLQQALSLALSSFQQQQQDQQAAQAPSSSAHPFSVVQQPTQTPAQQPPPPPLPPRDQQPPPPPLPPRYQHPPPPPLPPRDRLPLSRRQRYLPHLEQLHTMGITYSDAECLHALEAAQGDLQTALEILMGPGN